MFLACGGFYELIITVTLLILCYFLKSLLFPKSKVGDYENKYVLITGCDTGFGKNTAIRLDQMGFRVIACCLTKEGKDNLQTICSDHLVSVLMDVTDSKQIQDVFAQVKQLIPAENGLWAVINNAGYMTLGPLEWFKMEDYKNMADVNLWGLIEVTKTFLPLVKKAEGRIINFSSVAGLVCTYGFVPYSITKYGVEAFSDGLRREMVEWKVKVCIIEPQGFKTALLNEVTGKKMTSLWDGLNDDMKKEYGQNFLSKLRKKIAEMLENVSSPNTELVTDAIIVAVTSRGPAPRYQVGLVAKVISVLAAFPTTLQDTLFEQFLLKSDFLDKTNKHETT